MCDKNERFVFCFCLILMFTNRNVEKCNFGMFLKCSSESRVSACPEPLCLSKVQDWSTGTVFRFYSHIKKTWMYKRWDHVSNTPQIKFTFVRLSLLSPSLISLKICVCKCSVIQKNDNRKVCLSPHGPQGKRLLKCWHR